MNKRKDIAMENLTIDELEKKLMEVKHDITFKKGSHAELEQKKAEIEKAIEKLEVEFGEMLLEDERANLI